MEEAKDNSTPIRCETKHNQHRRSFWHDYHEVGIYMVTMVIEGRQRLFGTIAGHVNGQPGTDSELSWPETDVFFPSNVKYQKT